MPVPPAPRGGMLCPGLAVSTMYDNADSGYPGLQVCSLDPQ